MIVSYNGTHIPSNPVLARLDDANVQWRYIMPGEPAPNGFVESFDGRMCDGLLNETLFFAIGQARSIPTALGPKGHVRRLPTLP